MNIFVFNAYLNFHNGSFRSRAAHGNLQREPTPNAEWDIFTVVNVVGVSHGYGCVIVLIALVNTHFIGQKYIVLASKPHNLTRFMKTKLSLGRDKHNHCAIVIMFTLLYDSVASVAATLRRSWEIYADEIESYVHCENSKAIFSYHFMEIYFIQSTLYAIGSIIFAECFSLRFKILISFR